MVTRQDIQATCDDIVREFSPLQVILFGSYAYGTPTEDSDVDLLVVMDIPESETRQRAVEIGERVPHRFRMDLLVRSPKEIAYRVSYNDWFLREITEKGEVLYKAVDFFNKPLKKEKCFMNPLTLEWIQKAEADYDTVQLLQQVETASKDIICFHAQQCIEKYLKAWLQEANISFGKTHDLKELLALIVPTIPVWRAWRADLSTLSRHAVDFRYPGKSATASDVAHAMHICNKVREAVRAQLNLDPLHAHS
jgi:HEPN domain-containing protein/predicted nucleotidyltransferase